MKLILGDPLIGNRQYFSNYSIKIPTFFLSKKGILYQEKMTKKFNLQIRIDEVKILNNSDRYGTSSIFDRIQKIFTLM